MMEKRKRIVYLDLLRIFAVFGVVVIHVSAVGQSEGSNIALIYNSIVRWAVPVFFMISGAMFLRNDKEYTFEMMVKKYIPRFLICIAFWGILYSLLDVYLYSSFNIKTIIFSFINVITNHSGYHLWFLYALIALYIMVPVFRVIVKNLTQKQLAFVIVCWLVLSLGISQFNSITKALNIPISFDWYFPMIASWAGYFLLGYYLFNYDMPNKIKNVLIGLGTVSLFAGILCNIVATAKTGGIIDAFSDQSGLSSCLVAISIALIFKQLFNKNYSKKQSSIIQSISNKTFGIYLVHVLVINVIFHIFDIKIDIISQIISIPIFSIAVFVISFLITFLISKIPVLKKTVM